MDISSWRWACIYISRCWKKGGSSPNCSRCQHLSATPHSHRLRWWYWKPANWCTFRHSHRQVMTIFDNTIPSVCITATSSNILLQCHCTTAISECTILIASGMHSPVTGNVLQIICLWVAKSDRGSLCVKSGVVVPLCIKCTQPHIYQQTHLNCFAAV